MLRCLLFVLALAAAGAAQAQLRTLPGDAKRGTLSHAQGMTMQLNGTRVELSAGAQIRDGRNMIVLPTAVPPGVAVKYQLSADGKLNRAWILTPHEAAQPDLKR
jgi:hypothetical protein